MDVYYQTTVGDNPARLRQAIQIALARCEVLVITGGLGATQDDLTKETVAELFDLPMEEDKKAWQAICDYFCATGRLVCDSNHKQAMIPKGAQALYNQRGTAPGVLLREKGKTVVMLPGPPSEMRPMFLDQVAPVLADMTGRVLHSVYLETFGIAESALGEMLDDELSGENPTVALYAKPGRVEIRITASAENRRAAEKLCQPMAEHLKKKLGSAVYSDSRETPEEALVALLKSRKLKITTAESCTGGLISEKLTEVPGASEVLESASVTYSNRIKQEILGVSPETLEQYGAVSEQTASEMAQGALKNSGADLAISVTGLAGPGGGTEEKPVGLVYLGFAFGSRVFVRKMVAGQGKDRQTIRELAAACGLLTARHLIAHPNEPLPALLQNTEPGLEKADQPDAFQPVPEKKSVGRRLLEYFIPMKGDPVREWVRKIVLLIAIPTFIISASVLISGYIQSIQANDLLADLQDIYHETVSVSPAEKEEINYPADYDDSFFNLYKINHDVKGYIRIPNTKVDFPIVQGKNNDYYLRRNFKGQKNDYGVCFFDYRCDVKNPVGNSILYAHNMKDDAMFGSILRYKNLSYFQQHPMIEMDTVYRKGRYVIFAAFLSNASPKDGPVFAYHNQLSFADQKEFDSFMQEVSRRSYFVSGVDVRYGDELLTLSTCSYEVGSGRFVVMARRLREGESSTVDISHARQKKSSEILFPKAYYKKNHLKVPAYYGGSDDKTESSSRHPEHSSASDGSSAPEQSSGAKPDNPPGPEHPSHETPSGSPEKPSGETSSPEESGSSETPSGEVSGETSSEVPSGETSGETSAETPSGETSAETSSGEESGETPSEAPSGETSDETPSEETPSEEVPSEAASAETASEEAASVTEP